MLGIIFVPWLTLMYVIVAPGGIEGFDRVWLGLALFGDIASYGGGVGPQADPAVSGILNRVRGNVAS